MWRIPVSHSCIAVLAAWLGAAQTRPAAITSGQAFRLNGVTVPAGVPTWPVYPGDTITTLGSPATIFTSDGAVIQLEAGSQALVGRSGPATTIRVQSGSAAYSLPAASKTRLSTASGTAEPGTSGVASAPDSPARAGRFRPGRPPGPPKPPPPPSHSRRP